MKTPIIGLLLTLIAVSGLTQNLNFSVHGKYTHSITKEKLSAAGSMSDIITHYPSSWIDRYNSVEISVVGSGNTETAISSNDILTEEQRKMLGSLDFGDEIVINIGYQHKNSVTHEVENGSLHYSTTVVPDTEAQYSEGYDQLSKYIKGTVIDKISGEESGNLQQAVVRFTIDETGKVADAYISKSSGNTGIDNLLLDVINEMPDWKPASDAQGIQVEQEFEFTVWGSNDGC